MTALDHKALAAHLRGRLKAAGLNAGCRMQDHGGGSQVIDIYPRGGVDARFTSEQQQVLRDIARANRLTHVQGLPIHDADVYGHGITLYMGFAS